VVGERLEEIVEHLRVEAALRESEENLRYLSSSLLKAQEKEQQRISFGLHDELGQDLAALIIQQKSIDSGTAMTRV
jgi:signal transduction histidine kinase